MSTTTTTKLRWIIRRDLEEVLEIERAVYDPPWTEEDFVRLLRERTVIGKVATRGDRVVGFVIYDHQGGRIEILNLAVREECFGEGVGRSLVGEVTRKLDGRRHRYAATMVSEINVGAQVFFNRVGWRCVGIVRRPYEDSDLDAYRFVRLAGEGDLEPQEGRVDE